MNSSWFKKLRHIWTILSGSYSLYKAINAVNFYYFEVGVTSGGLGVTTLLIFDTYFDVLGGIYAVPQWVRYLPEEPMLF